MGQIWYTLDGTDPRLSRGAIDLHAIQYTGPITLVESAEVKARALHDGQWSTLGNAQLTIALPPRLAVVPPGPLGDGIQLGGAPREADAEGTMIRRDTRTADINGDGQLDAGDLRLIQANLGLERAATREEGDLDGDGRVTRRDLVRFFQDLEAGPVA